MTSRRLRHDLFSGCLAVIFVCGLVCPVSSSDFDLSASLADAHCDRAPSPLFFPCVMVDTTAGSRIKADSEMTVYSSAIHPDVIQIPGRWNRHRFWVSFSPYPHLVTGMGNENPHVACSDDGIHWANRVGKKRKQVIRNPIDRRNRTNRYTHLSDPDLVMDADSTLWVVYRAKFGTSPDTILFVASGSKDGINWSRPKVIVSGVTRPDLRHENAGLSPSILRLNGTFHLWYVNARSQPHRIYHLISDSLQGGWQAADSTDLGDNQPVRGDIWHMNVISSPDGSLLGLFTFTDSATHGENCKLRLASSTDSGRSWKLAPQWLLEHASDRNAWDGNQIYRSGGYFQKQDSGWVFNLYYSAMRLGKVPIWSTGLTTVYFDRSNNVDSTDNIK